LQTSNPSPPGDLLAPEQPSRKPGRLRHWLGLDRAIAFTVLARAWSSAAGLVTVALIARFLTGTEQGYFYTINSLVALQIIFELGFSFVILQMASHERAHLTVDPLGNISGDRVAHARLASVLQKAIRWYALAALLFLVVLLPAGMHFFSTHQRPGVQVAYVMPWLAAVVAAAINLQVNPVLSFFEGWGDVAPVARSRFFQALAGSSLAWAALATHHGLYAPALTILGQALAGLVWIGSRRKTLLQLLKHQPGEHRIPWMKEVWSFQWRIALSWIAGYFIFQIFTPVLFAYSGPVAAGQMGMSLNIVGALSAVALSWINTKAAPFGTMISRREFAKLDQVFFRALYQSLAVCAAGGLAIWIACLFLNTTGSPFASRMLAPFAFGLLLLSAVINHVWYSEAIYIRAHKQEKYLGVSVGIAILVSLTAFVLGKHFGSMGMAAGYLAVSVVVGFGFGTPIFLKYRRLWHAD